MATCNSMETGDFGKWMMSRNPGTLKMSHETLASLKSLREKQEREFSENEKLREIEELLEEEKRGLEGKEITEEIKEEISEINCLKCRIFSSKDSCKS